MIGPWIILINGNIQLRLSQASFPWCIMMNLQNAYLLQSAKTSIDDFPHKKHLPSKRDFPLPHLIARGGHRYTESSIPKPAKSHAARQWPESSHNFQPHWVWLFKQDKIATINQTNKHTQIIILLLMLLWCLWVVHDIILPFLNTTSKVSIEVIHDISFWGLMGPFLVGRSYWMKHGLNMPQNHPKSPETGLEMVRWQGLQQLSHFLLLGARIQAPEGFVQIPHRTPQRCDGSGKEVSMDPGGSLLAGTCGMMMYDVHITSYNHIMSYNIWKN